MYTPYPSSVSLYTIHHHLLPPLSPSRVCSIEVSLLSYLLLYPQHLEEEEGRMGREWWWQFLFPFYLFLLVLSYTCTFFAYLISGGYCFIVLVLPNKNEWAVQHAIRFWSIHSAVLSFCIFHGLLAFMMLYTNCSPTKLFSPNGLLFAHSKSGEKSRFLFPS